MRPAGLRPAEGTALGAFGGLGVIPPLASRSYASRADRLRVVLSAQAKSPPADYARRSWLRFGAGAGAKPQEWGTPVLVGPRLGRLRRMFAEAQGAPRQSGPCGVLIWGRHLRLRGLGVERPLMADRVDLGRLRRPLKNSTTSKSGWRFSAVHGRHGGRPLRFSTGSRAGPGVGSGSWRAIVR